jgi:dienelactone hydrolase
MRMAIGTIAATPRTWLADGEDVRCRNIAAEKFLWPHIASLVDASCIRSYPCPTMISRSTTPVILAAVLVVLSAVGTISAAQFDTRTAFLKLLDRPRVPLAPEESTPVNSEDGRVSRIAFNFAADAQQRVPGILVKSAVPKSSGDRRAVVIALHGTSGTKESQLPLLTELAQLGFIAVAMDGRYHGARTKSGKGSAEYSAAILRAYREGPNAEHPFFFDTAWDVMRLIDYLETRADVDAARIGVIGFSKGGIETYLAAAADPRIAVAVPCIGVQSFGWAIEHNGWQSRISTIQSAFDTAAQESRVAKPGPEFVRAFYDRVAPGIYDRFDGPAMLPLIAPRPLLSINGEVDDRTPLAGLEQCAAAARAAYKASGAEEKFILRIQPNTGHKVTPESMQLAKDWFVRWLKP